VSRSPRAEDKVGEGPKNEATQEKVERRKEMKKLSKYFACGLLVVFILAGCAKQPTDDMLLQRPWKI
jgi:hypothetical protein